MCMIQDGFRMCILNRYDKLILMLVFLRLILTVIVRLEEVYTYGENSVPSKLRIIC